MIESTLDSQLMELGIHSKPIVSLISYVVVDEDDPAFRDPSKPIGPILTRTRANRAPYQTRLTAKGWRRVVTSPRPVTIVEKREIMRLIELDFIVICCGGGGIPVIREGRTFCGVDAVIDKDLSSVKLAEEVGVDALYRHRRKRRHDQLRAARPGTLVGNDDGTSTRLSSARTISSRFDGTQDRSRHTIRGEPGQTGCDLLHRKH